VSGDGLVEHPADGDSVDNRPFGAETDDAAGEHIHDQHHPMAAQEDRFAAEEIDAPEAIPCLSDDSQPGRAGTPGVAWSVVFGEYATNDILIDRYAKDVSDLLGDAHIAELGIAGLQRNNRRDEFRGRAFRTWLAAMRRGGKQEAVFPIHQGFVELEQCGRLDERPSFGIRRGLSNSVVSPSTTRSSVVRFGARWRERLLISS